MRTLTRWGPKRELERLWDRFSTLFGESPFRLSEEGTESLALPEWVPMVDITETEKEYVVKADLPGVTKEEVKVTVENGLLSLSGERKSEKEVKGEKVHRVERTYGSFLRTFTLPEGVDAAKVAAEFKEGVLTVRLPKEETARPQAVTVKVE
jgi:HSP20 family protein